MFEQYQGKVGVVQGILDSIIEDNFVSLKKAISVMVQDKQLDFIMLQSEWFMRKWKQGT